MTLHRRIAGAHLRYDAPGVARAFRHVGGLGLVVGDMDILLDGERQGIGRDAGSFELFGDHLALDPGRFQAFIEGRRQTLEDGIVLTVDR